MIETEQVFMQTLNGLRRRRDEFNAAIASMEKLAGLKPGEECVVQRDDISPQRDDKLEQRDDSAPKPPKATESRDGPTDPPPAPKATTTASNGDTPRIPCPKDGCSGSGANMNSIYSHIHGSHYDQRETLRFKVREWYRKNVLERKPDTQSNEAPKVEAPKRQYQAVIKPCIQDPRIVKKNGNFTSRICGHGFLRVQDRYGHDQEFHPEG